MAQEYQNLGPIYTTAEKYEAARVAGTLETGREYKIIDWEAQEKLVAGDNITIAADGKTISASGGSSDSFIITGTPTAAEEFTIDKNKADIQAALNAGKNIFLKMENFGGDEGYILPLTQYKSSLATLLFSNEFNGYSKTFELKVDNETETNYEGTITDTSLSSVSVSDTGTAIQEVSYITINGEEKKIAGGSDPILEQSLTAGYTIGGITEGTVYAAGTSIESILRALLIKETPSSKKLYYSTGQTIPTSVSGMSTVDVTKETLLASGYTWKNIELDESYPFLAIDKSLGLVCYEISQGGFALGMISVDLGDQYLYYPETPMTDTGVRLVYSFEEE